MFVLLLSLIGGAAGMLVDETRVPGSQGHAVVEAALDMIQETCNFNNDRLFFRRLAYVASDDGDSPETYRSGFHGGIWQVTELMFEQTKVQNGIMKNITRDLDVIWENTKWEDLKKPLYSALAARLYIELMAPEIPISTADQARFWKTFYNQSGDVNDFIRLSNQMETGCRGGLGIDLVFVIDGSGSIGSDNFTKILGFMRDVIGELDIGPDDTRVGVVQFSGYATVEFHLNEYTSKADVISNISEIRYQGGGTEIHLALNTLSDVMYKVSNGARPLNQSHPRVAVVLTDGQSGYNQTKQAADRVHDQQITVLSVGVGSNLNMRELEAIASHPVCLHLSLLHDFTEISSLTHIIQKRSCDASIIINGALKLVLPPNGRQKCKIKIPASGGTVKITASPGSVNFYIARSKYPNEAYYDEKIRSDGYGADLYIRNMREQEDELFCNIEGGDSTTNKISILVVPGADQLCSSTPCQHGGTCEDLDGDYMCYCLPGYTGHNCETMSGLCSSRPCQHGGSCIDLEDRYICYCTPGYTGCNCERNSTCVSNPCMNGGYCTASGSNSGYTCSCPFPYTGHNCEVEINPCQSEPCVNGGECVTDGSHGYRCICPFQYTGDRCQATIHPCDLNPCKNDGRCSEDGNGFKCTCQAGYKGRHCEEKITETGYNCGKRNPCTPENIGNYRFYHPHTIRNKYVQCSEWGQCYVMNCPAGLVWDVTAYTCNRP